MLRRFVKDRPSMFDEPINKILDELKTLDPEVPEYRTMLNHLEALNKMKLEEKRNRVSPDTVAIVAGNLVGILIIVMYEQKHVVVSKALGFVMKTKHS